MARRNYSKKGRNIEPSVQTFVLPGPAIAPGITPTTMYVDLSQVASLMNRRFYRQGINWAVAGIKIITPSGLLGGVTLSKLPNTWVLSNAWTKSFKAWQKMNNEALAESESVRPKFLDFKIYADSDHHAAGFGGNLLPIAAGGVANAGEWESSKFVIPDNNNDVVQGREVIAVGANYPGAGASGLDAISMIEGYAASRSIPQPDDPATPVDAADAVGPTPENWLAALFADGIPQTDEVLNDMTTENNQAPYPFEGDGVNLDTMYPGGANQLIGLQFHDTELITSTTIGGTTRLKGGNFPCGLMRFDFTNETLEDDLAPLIYIDLIPGNHRGYLCEPMMEM